MQPFVFKTVAGLMVGAGIVKQIAAETARLGRHAFLVTGRSTRRAENLRRDLVAGDIVCTLYQVTREPDLESVSTGARTARQAKCDVVIGIGGGSVMDTAKAIAALITNQRPLLDYLEVIGKARPLDREPVPCIAVPTTAGTGSEVTRNAVIRSPQHRVKVSLRSPGMLPDLALVDPELTLSLPPELTAATGFDALTQLIEAFVSIRANPLTDGFCREGLARCARALKTVYHQGDNLAARTDMAIASLFSGLALANAGLGAVHGIAGPLGGLRTAPHGAVCARLLPVVTAANIAELEKTAPKSPFLARYQETARLLTGNREAGPRDGTAWLRATMRELNIPLLTHWGLTSAEKTDLAESALRASSMRGNPVRLDRQALEDIISKALHGDD